MPVITERLAPEAHQKLGDEIYERLRPQLEITDRGRIVAIDPLTGAFEISDQTLTAATQLHARFPDAQIWFVRVGHSGVHRFGFPTLRHSC